MGSLAVRESRLLAGGLCWQMRADYACTWSRPWSTCNMRSSHAHARTCARYALMLSNTNANQVPPGHLLNRCRLHKTRNRLRSAGLSLWEFPSTRTKVVNRGPFSKKLLHNHIINKKKIFFRRCKLRTKPFSRPAYSVFLHVCVPFI